MKTKTNRNYDYIILQPLVAIVYYLVLWIMDHVSSWTNGCIELVPENVRRDNAVLSYIFNQCWYTMPVPSYIMLYVVCILYVVCCMMYVCCMLYLCCMLYIVLWTYYYTVLVHEIDDIRVSKSNSVTLVFKGHYSCMTVKIVWYKVG